jgi:16S rRNA (guanine527-N7)-methyltransferase
VKHQLELVKVSRETLEGTREIYQKNEKDIERYLDLLLEWNEKINLVSRSVSRETLREHVVHSLIPMQLGLLEAFDSWIDSGSGGGLPGAPLAIANPAKRFFLNDNVKKKMRAVDDIIQQAGIKNSETVAKSISLVDLQKGTGIVTKHAFKIDDLLRLLGSKPWKTIIMWKGVEGAAEEIRTFNKKLNTTLYEFHFGDDEPFYEGKGLLVIQR